MHDRIPPPSPHLPHAEYLCISVVCSNLAQEVCSCLWPYAGGLNILVLPDREFVATRHICILRVWTFSPVWLVSPWSANTAETRIFLLTLYMDLKHTVSATFLIYIHPHLSILHIVPSYPVKAIFLLNKPGQQTKSNYVGQLPPGSG